MAVSVADIKHDIKLTAYSLPKFIFFSTGENTGWSKNVAIAFDRLYPHL